MSMNKKSLYAVCAAVMLVFSGCSLGGESSSTAEENQQTSQTETQQAEPVVAEAEEPEEDPMLAPERVVVTYLRAANAEFDRSMIKLMTDDYAAQYEYMEENMGHDDEYADDGGEQEFKYEFDHEKSGFIDEVNVDESYSKACEIYVTVTYGEQQEPTSQYLLLILDDKDNSWKICFAGTKEQAYTAGLIKDERSDQAMAQAKTVYEAAEAAYAELKETDDYKFEYMNYISTEDDEFINRIKEILPADLKASYFTVLLDGDKLDHIVWGENINSDLMVTYP